MAFQDNDLTYLYSDFDRNLSLYMARCELSLFIFISALSTWNKSLAKRYFYNQDKSVSSWNNSNKRGKLLFLGVWKLFVLIGTLQYFDETKISFYLFFHPPSFPKFFKIKDKVLPIFAKNNKSAQYSFLLSV